MSNLQTVKTLQCPNGSTVHIVGTAHFSQDSVDDVKRTIRTVRPNVVVLELCQDRQVILRYTQEDILREARNVTFTKMRSCIRREGLIAGITQSIFLKISAELTEKLGIAPGGEFRAGFEEGRAINARVVLGDRLIGITFKRAVAALTLWQKVRFMYSLVSSLSSEIDITPEEVERLKTQDMAQLLAGELANEFPSLLDVFLTERDQILAYSLMLAANCAQQPYGPAVTVVGVMGMGHVPGIESYWNQELDVRDLLVLPQPSAARRVLWKGTKLIFTFGFVSVCAGCVYFIGKRVFSYCSTV